MVMRLVGLLPRIRKCRNYLRHVRVDPHEVKDEIAIAAKGVMQVCHFLTHYLIEFWTLKHESSHAIRQALRIGGEAIMLVGVEGSGSSYVEPGEEQLSDPS